MNQKTSKIYNYKQIAEGIDYKNPRQRELVIQALHRLLATEKIKEAEKDLLDSMYDNPGGKVFDLNNELNGGLS